MKKAGATRGPIAIRAHLQKDRRIHEGEKVNEGAFKSLIRAAVAANATAGRTRRAKK